MFGSRDYSMRIWLDPDRLQSLGLTATDVTNALQAQNIQVASGVLDQPPVAHQGAFQIAVQTLGRLADPDEFGVDRRQADAGRRGAAEGRRQVELAALDYSSNSYLDHDPAVALAIFQRPGSNALDDRERRHDLMDKLSKRFPSGVKYAIVYNPTQFIQQSVDAVIETIGEAIVLVVLVVIVFLQTWRAAIIPLVAIPVSLIGTFFFMAAFGFTLNNLSLFGLVLAIGIVVDDAIVVVENVERNIAAGLAPREAARKSMDEVGSALIAIALVLCAVFVPSVFITGISGQFYRQFALTIAGATIISLIVSLTLSPAMCALLLKPHDPSHRDRWWERPIHGFFGLFNRGFDARRRRRVLARDAHGAARRDHGRGLSRRARRSASTPSGRRRSASFRRSTAAISSSWCNCRPAPRSRAPTRCSSARSTSRSACPASSTASMSSAFPAPPSPMRRTPAPSSWCSIPSTSARHDPRQSAAAIQAELNNRLSTLQEAFIIAVLPPPVRGIGTAGGFRMIVEDRAGHGPAALQQAAAAIDGARRRRRPASPTSSRCSRPRRRRSISTSTAPRRNSSASMCRTCSTRCRSISARPMSTTSICSAAPSASPRRRATKTASRSPTCSRSACATSTATPCRSAPSPPCATFPGRIRVPRYNLYPAAELDGAAAPGYSQGQAIALMDKLAAETLPDGFATEWTTLAFQQIRAGNTAMFAFVLAVVFVFLVLAAQYESLTLPLAVIMIVPMCLVAAITGVILRGQDNNILTQVGFVVLIGLAAKNAILIVEFARQLEERLRLLERGAAPPAAGEPAAAAASSHKREGVGWRDRGASRLRRCGRVDL